MKKINTLRGASMVAAISLLPLSQAALGEVTISGWINEGVQFYDDGQSTSDFVQSSDNGTTLGSRITFSGSSEVAPGLTGGFEVIVEPQSKQTPLIFSNQDDGLGKSSGKFDGGRFDDNNGHSLGVLGSSLNVGGAWGKVTVGLQSMPTDNIAVLEDPSLTLWSGISPVFRGNGFSIKNKEDTVGVNEGVVADNDAVWGDYLNCFTASGLRGAGGIGIDCNGIYRNGVRYDLPAFGPVTVAVGYANDDIYDVAAKFKQDYRGFSTSLALGYAVNNGVNGQDYDEASNFQLQAGLMHKASGIFGSIAYQHEEADLINGVQAEASRDSLKEMDDAAEALIAAVVAENAATPGDPAHEAARRAGAKATAKLRDATVAYANGEGLNGKVSDSSDAWWFKVGVKRPIFSVGDTSISFDYGQYNDQYNVSAANVGVNGSEVERMGVSIDQYFGSNLIIYGKWEQLDLSLDTSTTSNVYHKLEHGNSFGSGTEELDTYTLGATYFF